MFVLAAGVVDGVLEDDEDDDDSDFDDPFDPLELPLDAVEALDSLFVSPPDFLFDEDA